MTPRTALIICARAPRRVLPVPAVRELPESETSGKGKAVRFRSLHEPSRARDAIVSDSVSSWRCSWCGARVKVVA